MPKVDEAYLEERRKYIIDCALEVLAEKPLEQITMRDVIRKTGFSQGTIYNYYKNMDELLTVLLCQYMYRMKQILEEDIQKEQDFFSCYHRVCQDMAKLYEDEPQLFKAILGEISFHDNKQQEHDALYDVYRVGEELNEVIIFLLERGRKEKIVREGLNFHVVVFHLWSGIAQTILFSYNKQTYLQSCFHMTREEYMEQEFELLIHSIVNPK